MKTFYHIPALLEESVNGLLIKPDGVYVDTTFGGGGHSREILKRLGADGRLYGFDQDSDAMTNIPDDSRFTFVHGNFRFLTNFMHYYKEENVDGILADLGVSFHHFDNADRGFSFRFDGRLDMRMNQNSQKDAAFVVETYSEESLANLFYRYGELKNARKIARSLVCERRRNAISSIGNFVDVIKPYLSRKQEKKELAQAFQALRMEVNQETEALQEMLLQAKELLKPGGRIAVISYHSQEDRLVKNFLKTGNFEGKLEQDFYGNIHSPFHTEKKIAPSETEIERNPRSRSAKLRIAEKIML